MSKRCALVVLVVLVGSCAGGASETRTRETSRGATTDSGDEPTYSAPPFSAAELRAGLPIGTEIKLRVIALSAPPVVQHWTFTAADETGCTIHARILDEDGSLLEDKGSGTSTWEELVSHARFPASLTTSMRSRIRVPAGAFETWYFEVRPEEAGGPTKRLHFAHDLPGPPVSMEIIQNDKVILKMELVSRKPASHD